MNNQVLTIEQMQELIDMGVDTSNASCIWWNFADLDCVMFLNDGRELLTIERMKENHGADNITPTFTLQDILEILPSYKITYDKYTNDSDKYEIRVDIPEGQHYITHIARSSESLLEAAFKMLKWCKHNNYISQGNDIWI